MVPAGEQAREALRKGFKETDSAEVRFRIEPLLKTLDEWFISDPDTIQSVRAIWVLQRIGTPDARAVLEKLANGAPEVRQTVEAQAALDWLAADKKIKIEPKPEPKP